MHYSDDVRTLNLVGGFVLGALVGAGVGLISRPLAPTSTPRRIRGAAERARHSARGGARHLRSRISRFPG